MTKEEIEKFYEKYCTEKPKEVDYKFPRFWEVPPIPEGKRLVFEGY